jgi:hypothetical protein
MLSRLGEFGGHPAGDDAGTGGLDLLEGVERARCLSSAFQISARASCAFGTAWRRRTNASVANSCGERRHCALVCPIAP